MNQKLFERSKRCVCRFCGSKLELRMVIFNQYGGQGVELYCPKCDKIEYGTEEKFYQLAKKFVDEYEFNYYVDMTEDEYSKQLNVGKITQIMEWYEKECQKDLEK